MEELKKILQKIEQPLHFASQNDFKNLVHIKDLGKTLLHLSTLLKGSLPSGLKDDSFTLTDELLSIFSDYDWQKLELKKLKIQKATGLLAEIKKAVDLIQVKGGRHDEQSVQRITDLKEALAKLKLPVQYLKGVGPKMAQRFGAKKITDVEDLLLFLPRAYEDRREI